MKMGIFSKLKEKRKEKKSKAYADMAYEKAKEEYELAKKRDDTRKLLRDTKKIKYAKYTDAFSSFKASMADRRKATEAKYKSKAKIAGYKAKAEDMKKKTDQRRFGEGINPAFSIGGKKD